MVSSQFYANHYEERANRRDVDPVMGTVSVAGPAATAAWQGMTALPNDQEPPRRREPPLTQQVTEPLAPYDAALEEERRAARERGLREYESQPCSALPGDSTCQPSRGAKPPATSQNAPFANEDSVARDEYQPRGRKVVAQRSLEKEEQRVTGRRHCRAAKESGNAATFAVTSAKSDDAFAIGDTRSRNFLIRDRPTKRVFSNAQRATFFANDAPSAPSRREFPEAGVSCLSFDGALSAALPEVRSGRRVVAVEPPTQRPERPGRRQFDRSGTLTLADGTELVTSREDDPSSLDHFAAWYRSEYGCEPPRAALEHAAQTIVDKKQQHAVDDTTNKTLRQPWDTTHGRSGGGEV